VGITFVHLALWSAGHLENTADWLLGFAPPHTLGHAVLNKEFLPTLRTGAACCEDIFHQGIEAETRTAVSANDAVLVKFKLSFPRHVKQYRSVGMSTPCGYYESAHLQEFRLPQE
jgi:hypothetical protein